MSARIARFSLLLHLARGRNPSSIQFRALVVFLVIVFLFGGSARADVQSLVFLRPIAILTCGFALLTLSRENITGYRFLFGFAAALFALVAIHLVPLPYSVWRALPGRELILQIDQATGIAPHWRPLSLAPDGTLNALFSLAVPLAVLLLVVQISDREKRALLPVLIGLAVVSGLVGLLQIAGDTNLLYFYRVTNDGAAVGLFANRNHAAMLLSCLFPMLAVFASVPSETAEKQRFRLWVSVAIGLSTVPLLLVTGSRTGIISGAIGLVFAFLLFRTVGGKSGGGARRQWVLPGVALVGIVFIFIIFSRAQGIERLIVMEPKDLRFQVWGPIASAAWNYFPFGSGIGSFVEAFKVNEPTLVLRPSYLNHAHNDWLEIYLTGGLPALAFGLVALAAFALRSYAAWQRSARDRREIAYARLGSAILFLCGVASVTDYPLRAPSAMCFAVIAAVWLVGAPARNKPSSVPSNA